MPDLEETMARKRARKPRAVTTPAAERTLDRMIAEKQQAVGDGSLQVILAIASCTSLVTVDLTKTPPKITPPNLGTLTFNDPTVGLSNTQMAIFKANLAALLPEIAADIAQIPENAGLKISAVATFVRLALLAS
jgi:hypothetical protein